MACAVVGCLLSTVLAALVLALAMLGDVDHDGRTPAKHAAQQLALACVLAGYWTPVGADLVAWLTR